MNAVRDDGFISQMRKLLPSWVTVTGAAWGTDYIPNLTPEELRVASLFSPGRLLEFGAGRDCARRALGLLGREPASIPVDKNRAPVWPKGIRGSITHVDRYCVVAIVQTSRCDAIGIDMERIDRVTPDLDNLVLTSKERMTSGQMPEGFRAAVFSAKECLYKCYSPLTKEFLEFHDVNVTIDWRAHSFVATISSSVPSVSGQRSFCGKFSEDGEYVYTTLLV